MNEDLAGLEEFSFLSRSGLIGAAQLGAGQDPYARAIGGAASQAWQDGITGAEWLFQGNRIIADYGERISAYPSPSMQSVVVILQERVHFPHNALVLNANGSVRHHIRQPERYVGQWTEFLYARWYERGFPPSARPRWAFWRHAPEPVLETRMKMLIGWSGDPTGSFEALDFDPETGTFGDIVDSGRL